MTNSNFKTQILGFKEKVTLSDYDIDCKRHYRFEGSK